MERIKINLRSPGKKEIDLIVNFLNQGKVIVYPTDTIYGLGCRATDRRAIKKIYKIKRRERGKPFLVLMDSIKMAKKYCYVSKEQEKVLKRMRQQTSDVFKERRTSMRAVTAILKAKDNLPKELMGREKGLAVRLPKNDFLIKIIKRIGESLVSTSANVSGEKSLTSVRNMEKMFLASLGPATNGAHANISLGNKKEYLPDLVVDGGVLKGKPSVVIDLRDVGNIKILRK